MVNRILFLMLTLFLSLSSSYAFEDYIIATNGKLTDISVENNKIVNVYPLITVMNDKNILIVSPLQTGHTRFCVLKNGKEKVMFHIDIKKNETHIDEVDGFDILSIDTPPNYVSLDYPPIFKEETQ